MPDTAGRSGGGRNDSKGPRSDSKGPRSQEERERERRDRRAAFLRELNEARELRDRVQPRKARAARMRQQMRMRTFRW